MNKIKTRKQRESLIISTEQRLATDSQSEAGQNGLEKPLLRSNSLSPCQQVGYVKPLIRVNDLSHTVGILDAIADYHRGRCRVSDRPKKRAEPPYHPQPNSGMKNLITRVCKFFPAEND